MVRESSRETSEVSEVSQVTEQSDLDGDYQEIRDHLKRWPDIRQLRNCEAAQRQLEIQRADEQKNHGHALSKHCVEAKVCQQRAADLPGERHPKDPPENATRFTSKEAMIAAASANWSTEQAHEQRELADSDYYMAAEGSKAPDDELAKIARRHRIVSRMRAEDALGPDWRTHIDGYTTASRGETPTHFGPDTEVVTVWKMKPDGTWCILTCFPDHPE